MNEPMPDLLHDESAAAERAAACACSDSCLFSLWSSTSRATVVGSAVVGGPESDVAGAGSWDSDALSGLLGGARSTRVLPTAVASAATISGGVSREESLASDSQAVARPAPEPLPTGTCCFPGRRSSRHSRRAGLSAHRGRHSIGHPRPFRCGRRSLPGFCRRRCPSHSGSGCRSGCRR